MTVGVAGCGAMGRPMAENLAQAGYDVIGFDVRPLSDFDAFAGHMVTDAGDLAARCETLISVVRDIAETEALLFEDQAILRRDDHPTTLVLSSTLSPRYIVDVAGRVPDDVTVIDAPMSGAPYRARAGTLTFMVGGGAGTVTSLMPLFEAMGDGVHHVGGVGTGAAAKVCNNLCGIAGVVAVRRALSTAATYGLGEETLLEIMRSSSGSTWYGDNLDKIDWGREGYDPANTIGILEKDVRSFADAADGPGDFEAALIAEIQRMEPLT